MSGLIKQATQKAKIKKINNIPPVDIFVDKILKLDLSVPEKRKIGTQYRELSGLTSGQITYARNRNSYYRKLKNKNHNLRQTVRNKKSKSTEQIKRNWSVNELKEFVKLNTKKTDRQLAEYFKRSIPAINSIRRRINSIAKIIKCDQNYNTEKKKTELIQKNENYLRDLLKNNLKTKQSVDKVAR